MLDVWNTPLFGERFAKFYNLLLRAEDQDEMDQLKLTTAYEKKFNELFRSKSLGFRVTFTVQICYFKNASHLQTHG